MAGHESNATRRTSFADSNGSPEAATGLADAVVAQAY